MQKNNFKKFLIACSCFAALSAGQMALAEDKVVAKAPNKLDKIVFKKISENKVELRLETEKLLPSAPILFEKGHNVYFVSLPSTAYNGARKPKINRVDDNLKDVTVEFISYKIAEDNGYTRMIIETKGNTDIELINVESLGTKGIALVLIASFFGLILVTVFAAGGYYTYKRMRSKQEFYRMFSASPIEIDDVVEDNSENILSSAEFEIDPADANEDSDSVDLYPSPDEIVDDLLANDDAIAELSESVVDEVNSRINEDDESDSDPIDIITFGDENSYEAVSVEPNSAAAVFESKLFIDASQTNDYAYSGNESHDLDEVFFEEEEVSDDDSTFDDIIVDDSDELSKVEDDVASDIEQLVQISEVTNVEDVQLVQEEVVEEIVEEVAALPKQDTTDVLPVTSEEPVEVVEVESVDEEEPEVLSAQGITDDKSLYLIKQGKIVSLLGVVGEEAFLLNTFDTPPQDNTITLFENEEKDNEVIYIVKVGTWRALISVKDDSMKNILTLS